MEVCRMLEAVEFFARGAPTPLFEEHLISAKFPDILERFV
jgi:hypothetical protein